MVIHLALILLSRHSSVQFLFVSLFMGKSHYALAIGSSYEPQYILILSYYNNTSPPIRVLLGHNLKQEHSESTDLLG